MRVPNTVQTEQELKDVLDRLYAESAKGKSFTGILELISNEQTIITAIHKIKSNRGAKTPGVDGKTIDHYLQMPQSQLIGLIKNQLKDYTPRKVRRHYIPKKNGKMRPLGIPCLIDRIIQECIRIVIEPILEARFYKHSYGFRPYRATGHAVARVVSLVHKQRYWCIEGDIKGFFDHVNHRLLIQKLERLGIIDKRVLAIIKKMLKAEVFDNGNHIRTDEGTPQGGILSPLLANAYLNDFDWMIARRYDSHRSLESSSNLTYSRKKLGVEPIFLTRYADDWVIQTTTEQECKTNLRKLTKYFKHRMKLELSTDKTLITDCRQKSIRFLGYCIVAQNRRVTPEKPVTALVGKVYPNPKKVVEQKRTLLDKIKKMAKLNEKDRAVEIERLNSKIVGIAEYWRQCIAGKTYSKLDRAIDVALHYAFAKAYGKGYRKQKVSLSALANRPNRHKFDNNGRPVIRKDKSWSVRIEGMWIGVTKFYLTPIKYALKFNPAMNPYSIEGREAYAKSTNGRRFPISRPALYDDLTFVQAIKGQTVSIYNFEYMMNREYAFNQTLRKGQHCCSACDSELVKGNRHCHHKNGNLPLDKVNKVKNLVWLCKQCRIYVENGYPEWLDLPEKRRKKIEKLREIKFGSGVA